MKEFTLSVNGEEYDVSANTLEEAKGYLLKSLQGDRAVSALEQSRATGSQSPTATQPPAQPDRLQLFGQDVFPTSPQDALNEMGQNIGIAAEGAVKGLASVPAMVADPLVAGMNQLFGTHAPTVAGMIGQLFQGLGVPPEQARSEFQKVMGAVTQGMAGAGSLAGTAGAVAPVLTGAQKGMAQALASQPVQQMVGGGTAVLGGLGGQEAAKALGGDQKAQDIAGLVGEIGLGTMGAIATPGARATSATNDILKSAESEGIDVTTSQVFPPKTPGAKNAQRAIEGNPFLGTGPMYVKQQAQREQAVKNLVREFGADDAERITDEVMQDALKYRKDEIGKYYTAKMEVLKRLDDLGGVVATPRALEAIDKEIARMKSINSNEASAVVSKLENWKGSLLGKDGKGQKLLNVEEIRGMVGDSYSPTDIVDDATKKIGKKSANPIYHAIKEDMADHIRNNGIAQDFTKWSVANKRLSNMIEDLEMSSFNRALAKGDIEPEVVTNLLFSKTPSRAEMLYSGLTDSGKAKAETAIIAKAYEDALKSPNVAGAFMQSIENMGVPVKTFFKGEKLDRLRGLQKVIDQTSHADVATSNPATGQTNIVPNLTLGIVGGPALLALSGTGGVLGGAAGAGGLTALGIASRVYESKTVRDLLVKISQAKNGSAEEREMIKKYVATSSAVANNLTQSNSDRTRDAQKEQK